MGLSKGSTFSTKTKHLRSVERKIPLYRKRNHALGSSSHLPVSQLAKLSAMTRDETENKGRVEVKNEDSLLTQDDANSVRGAVGTIQAATEQVDHNDIRPEDWAKLAMNLSHQALSEPVRRDDVGNQAAITPSKDYYSDVSRPGLPPRGPLWFGLAIGDLLLETPYSFLSSELSREGGG